MSVDSEIDLVLSLLEHFVSTGSIESVPRQTGSWELIISRRPFDQSEFIYMVTQCMYQYICSFCRVGFDHLEAIIFYNDVAERSDSLLVDFVLSKVVIDNVES